MTVQLVAFVVAVQVLLVAWLIRAQRADVHARYRELRLRHRAALRTLRQVSEIVDRNEVWGRRVETVRLLLAPWRSRLAMPSHRGRPKAMR